MLFRPGPSYCVEWFGRCDMNRVREVQLASWLLERLAVDLESTKMTYHLFYTDVPGVTKSQYQFTKASSDLVSLQRT